MMETYWRFCIAACISLAVTSCSAGGSVAQPTHTPSSPEVSSTVEPSPSPQLNNVARIVTTTRDGDKATADLFLGVPVPLSEADPIVSQCALSATNVSPDRALAVPFQVTLYMQSPIPGRLLLTLGPGELSGTYLTSPSQDCNPGSGIYLVSIPRAAPSTYVYEGWKILPNVITPAEPQGDPSLLANYVFTPGLYIGNAAGSARESDISGSQVCKAQRHVYIASKPDNCN